ncbi:MAG: hypothetical protein E6J41_17580 [Chloroflexi bacterium]|nr:MAG: hypothetical protein E6J41_17580 [Chloroflexota bacterium]
MRFDEYAGAVGGESRGADADPPCVFVASVAPCFDRSDEIARRDSFRTGLLEIGSGGRGMRTLMLGPAVPEICGIRDGGMWSPEPGEDGIVERRRRR